MAIGFLNRWYCDIEFFFFKVLGNRIIANNNPIKGLNLKIQVKYLREEYFSSRKTIVHLVTL